MDWKKFWHKGDLDLAHQRRNWNSTRRSCGGSSGTQKQRILSTIYVTVPLPVVRRCQT